MTKIEDTRLVGLRDLRGILGCSSRQIHAWYSRRSGGFPEPRVIKGKAEYPGDRPGTPLFDLGEVLRWFDSYDPNGARGAHWAEKRNASGPLQRPTLD